MRIEFQNRVHHSGIIVECGCALMSAPVTEDCRSDIIFNDFFQLCAHLKAIIDDCVIVKNSNGLIGRVLYVCDDQGN